MSAQEISRLVNDGEVSAEEVVTAHLLHINEVDGVIKAFLNVDAEGAVESARAVDAKRQSGAALGSMAGIPVALKDVVAQKGRPTTWCDTRVRCPNQ